MTWADPPPGPLVLEPYDSPQHPLAPWFNYWREERRKHYASREPMPPRRSALLTVVRNEALFLPIWLRYYSRFFAPEDIYVVDHESTDGSTEGGGFVRIPTRHKKVDNAWLLATFEEHQSRLLEDYDVVVVADVDEIIVPSPPLGTLGDYLARFDEEWVNCLGYEVLHMRDSEPPFDPDRPVLEQRSTWFATAAYDKPAIASAPIKWQLGRHRRADYQFNGDPDLRLVHLHRVDYEICKQRHQRWKDARWNKRDLREGWATHNRITEGEEFDRWFYEDSGLTNYELIREPIGDVWKGAF